MRPMKVNLTVEGRYRVVVSRGDGSVKKDTGWFKNLITNRGLELIGEKTVTSSSQEATSNALLTQFYVGSGNSTPSLSDAQLDNFVAETSGNFSTTNSSFDSDFSRGYLRATLNKQFGEGVAAGNLAEIGIGPTSTDLFSRALILDSEGNPTTITVLENEFLTVYYELRINHPTTDFVSTIDVLEDGNPVPTTITIRAANANNDLFETRWRFVTARFTNIWQPGIFGGALGTEVQIPADKHGAVGSDEMPLQPYVGGSHERLMDIILPLSKWNGLTIRSITWHMTFAAWQMELDPTLTKNDTQEIRFRVGTSWSRA